MYFAIKNRPWAVLWPKQKWKLRKNCLLKSGLRYLIGWVLKASESAKDRGQFYDFGTFLLYFLAFLEAPYKPFLDKSVTTILKQPLIPRWRTPHILWRARGTTQIWPIGKLIYSITSGAFFRAPQRTYCSSCHHHETWWREIWYITILLHLENTKYLCSIIWISRFSKFSEGEGESEGSKVYW